MKIFVVTSGIYSDYDINSIYSTKGKAQEYINIRNKISGYPHMNDYIEEYELDAIGEVQRIEAEYDVEEGSIVYREGWTINNPCLCGGVFECVVSFNINTKVMEKSVYDKYAEWKALESGI